ncbi:MAG: hypothetical protein NVSMB39_4960 [Candidatus Saccharimonadales bacterium]
MTRTKAINHQSSEVQFVQGGPFELDIDWNRPLGSMLAEANFDNRPDNLLRTRLDIGASSLRSGKVEAEIAVLTRRSSTEDILRSFDRLDMRPGTYRELVQLAIDEPDLQRKLSIVALGSILNTRHKDYIGYLDGNVDERKLMLGWAGTGWRARYGFIVFPK